MSGTAFIIGAGGWGTALGCVLADGFAEVLLREHDAEHAELVQRTRENAPFLAGVRIADNMRVQASEEGLERAELVLLVTPSQFFRASCEALLKKVPAGALCVVATKGVEPGSLQTMSQVAEDVARRQGIRGLRFATLSGPSHAEEVGRRMATTVVAAARTLADAKECQLAFSRPYFRVYTSDDHLGVELGGALKNVIALAAGIADGLGLGDNAKAALMTRGLAEITRLGVALGAKPATFAGLAGMGDLVVTCMSRHSRNRSVGERLGRGEKWPEISKGMRQVAEGVLSCQSAMEMAKKWHVELPICSQVHAVLFDGKAAALAMQDLMSRELKSEA